MMETDEKRALFTVLATNALAARATTTAEFKTAQEGASNLAALAFPYPPEETQEDPSQGVGPVGL